MNPMRLKSKEDQMATKRKAKAKAPAVNLRGDETAAELYTLYMKARQGTDKNAVTYLRTAWQTQYNKEKGDKAAHA
jgi:hypothetical protein